MRQTYDVVESYTGNGSVKDYSFDFKIGNLQQLLVVVLNSLGVEVSRVRGDDATIIDTVTFDANDGGGSVKLLSNLTTNYKIFIYLADDVPIQPFRFRNKMEFTLLQIESALDWVSGQIQRLRFLMSSAIRMPDTLDMDLFNPMFPPDFQPGSILNVNETGDGFSWGPSVASISSDLAASEAAAAAADASQAAAAAAQISSESAQAAAESAQQGAEDAQSAAEAAQAAAEAAAGSISVAVTGAWDNPITVASSGTIAPAGVGNETIFIASTGSPATDVSIGNGSSNGDKLRLIFTSDSATVEIKDGNNTKMFGDIIGSQYVTIEFMWVSVLNDWIELNRNN